MQHTFREASLQLVKIDSRVSAFPGCEKLEIRPEVLRKYLTVEPFQFTEFLCALRIRFEVRHAGLPDVLRDIDLVGNRSVFDILHIFIKPEIHVFLHLDHSGWVGCHAESGVPLDSHTHYHIVSCGVVLDVEHL